VFISRFSGFSLFVALFQFLLCDFSLFTFFTVSHHIPGHTVCVSHFPRFSVLSP
jgi:hypothetical protein